MKGKRIAAVLAAILFFTACSSCSEQEEYVFVVGNSDSESRSETLTEETELDLKDATEDKEESIFSSDSDLDTTKRSSSVDEMSEPPEETSDMTSDSIAKPTETISESRETTAETTEKEQETSVTSIPETSIPVTSIPVTSESETKTPEKATLSLVSLTETVARGNKAKLVISGEPGVEYTIKVYYSSGASTAKGLEDHTADSKGLVTWEWLVGSRTKAGSHRIVVSGGGNTLTLYFTTTE